MPRAVSASLVTQRFREGWATFMTSAQDSRGAFLAWMLAVRMACRCCMQAVGAGMLGELGFTYLRVRHVGLKPVEYSAASNSLPPS